MAKVVIKNGKIVKGSVKDLGNDNEITNSNINIGGFSIFGNDDDDDDDSVETFTWKGW